RATDSLAHSPKPSFDFGLGKLRPDSHQDDSAKQAGEADHRQRQRPKDAVVDGRARKPDDFALVERAPPQDRIMDDRQVDRPDEPVNCGDTPLPASLALSPRQADVTEVEE